MRIEKKFSKQNTKNNYYLLISFIIALLILPQTFVKGQPLKTDSSHFYISTAFLSYNSYSQQKNNMPMRMGYPVLQTRTALASVKYKIIKPQTIHSLTCETSIPRRLNSDNGTGKNFLLKQNQSHYFRGNLEINSKRSFSNAAWNNIRIAV